MARLTTLALGALVLIPAAWSGAWFYGKSEIKSQLDEQIALLAQQGVAASYRSLEVGGYPFAYEGRIVSPRYQAPLMTAEGQGRTDWQAPWVSFNASLGNLGAVDFTLPSDQTVKIAPPRAANAIDVLIQSDSFTGRLSQQEGRMRIDSAARKLDVSVTPTGEMARTVFVDRLDATALSPVDQPGVTETVLTLAGVTADETLWGLIDPAKAFPRTPASLTISATAQTVRDGETPPRVESVSLRNLDVVAAGVKLDGEGQAVVKNRTPDGSFRLTLSGASAFLDRIVEAGLAPETQIGLARVMLDSYAAPADAAGAATYTIAFKDGYVYVNGRPTFLPVPTLPQ